MSQGIFMLDGSFDLWCVVQIVGMAAVIWLAFFYPRTKLGRWHRRQVRKWFDRMYPKDD